MSKWVYSFGNGKAEGSARRADLLGGKGANLAEMCLIGLAVPPGFTITTELCSRYVQENCSTPKSLQQQVEAALAELGNGCGKRYGDKDNPLLLSVRSGSEASMPGMLDTVLNLGLNDNTVEALARQTKDARFAYDTYRRFVQIFADVVMGVDHEQFEEIIEDIRFSRGVEFENQLEAEDWVGILGRFKDAIKHETGETFPQDPHQQLWSAIEAVLKSWQNPRAVTYRNLKNISDEVGTAVNVQAMVFGNRGEDSASGVAFTRNPSTGENNLFGEYLLNSQGEDVVAGIRTPSFINERARIAAGSDDPSMEKTLPDAYEEFLRVLNMLENHYCDMQDVEFTVENGSLWLLQTRKGKRTSKAALRIAVEMAEEGLISKEEAVRRLDQAALSRLVNDIVDPDAVGKMFAKGLPASPGATAGEIVFTSDAAIAARTAGRKAILVRKETSPRDIAGMDAAAGILTSGGGMTSHAAVVARSLGKPCVCGAMSLRISYDKKSMASLGNILGEGDEITIDGSNGSVFSGSLPLITPKPSGNLAKLVAWSTANAG